MTRPRQSGMEAKHEEAVNAVLNFLHQHNVQTYEGGWNANSSEGMNLKKGPVLSIPERLILLSGKIRDAGVAHSKLRSALWREEAGHRETRDRLMAAEDQLELLWDMLKDGIDMDALQQDETLEAYMRKRRPHLFEEEDDDDEPTEA